MISATNPTPPQVVLQRTLLWFRKTRQHLTMKLDYIFVNTPADSEKLWNFTNCCKATDLLVMYWTQQPRHLTKPAKSVSHLSLCFQEYLQRDVSNIEVKSSSKVVQRQTVPSYTSISAAQSWCERRCLQLQLSPHLLQWISCLQPIFEEDARKEFTSTHKQHSELWSTNFEKIVIIWCRHAWNKETTETYQGIWRNGPDR